MWATLTGTRTFRFKPLRDQYGPGVRVGLDEISFIDPGAWNDIYGPRPSGKDGKIPKDPTFYNAFDDPDKSNLPIARGGDHARMRYVQ